MAKSWKGLAPVQTTPINTNRDKNLGRAGAVAQPNEWRNLCKRYGSRCLSCNKGMKIDDLTRDHIIPVSNPLSSNSIDNLQPLCRRCNELKGDLIIDFRPDKSCVIPAQLPQGLRDIWRNWQAQRIKAGMTGAPMPANEAKVSKPKGPDPLQVQAAAHKAKLAKLHLAHEKMSNERDELKQCLVLTVFKHSSLPAWVRWILNRYGFKIIVPEYFPDFMRYALSQSDKPD